MWLCVSCLFFYFRFAHVLLTFHAVLFLVEQQIQALPAVEGEAGVARHQRQLLSDGVGDDHVVRRVFVTVCGVRAETGVCEHVLPPQWQNPDEEVLLYRANHLLGGLPVFRVEALVVIADHKLADRLGAQVELGIRLVQQVIHIC